MEAATRSVQIMPTGQRTDTGSSQTTPASIYYQQRIPSGASPIHRWDIKSLFLSIKHSIDFIVGNYRKHIQVKIIINIESNSKICRNSLHDAYNNSNQTNARNYIMIAAICECSTIIRKTKIPNNSLASYFYMLFW